MELPEELRERMRAIQERMRINAEEARVLVEEGTAIRHELMAYLEKHMPVEAAVVRAIEKKLFPEPEREVNLPIRIDKEPAKA